MSIPEYSAVKLKELLETKQISALEIARALLDRIKKHDAEVKSFLYIDEDLLLKEAQASDQRRSQGKVRGILEGIPVALKDNICTKGQRTTCASQILPRFFPPYNAHVVEKIQASGGSILGKTNMDEFAMGSSCENSSFFNTHNPWNLNCIPGGSSGGSAAAVTAGFTPLALGSDTGGSVRQPAGLCGVFGLKPTYGRVSRFGLIAYGSSLDQIGTFSRSARDAALLLEVIAGRDQRDSTSVDQPVSSYQEKLLSSLKGKKIGLPQEYFENLDEEMKASIMAAVEVFRSLGVEVEEVSLPHTQYAVAAYYIIATAEASANLARYDGIHYGYRAEINAQNTKVEDLQEIYHESRAQGFGNEVKRRILLGTYALSSGYYDAYYVKALQVRTLIKRDIEKALEKFDVLLTPTSPVSAFPLGEKIEDPLSMYLCDIYTVTFNLSGNPALSVPCGHDKKDLPVGFQLVGKLFKEEEILAFAHQYEKETLVNTLAPIKKA